MKKNNNNNNNICNNDLYNKLNNTDKILFILYSNPKVTQESLLPKWCYPVTSVTSVTSVTPNRVNKNTKKNGTGGVGNTSNTSNTSNRVTPVTVPEYEDKNKLKVTINRLVKRGLVLKDESSTPYHYQLSAEGIKYVEDKINKYEEEINKIIELEETKSLYDRIYDNLKEFINNNLAKYVNQIQTKGVFNIDLLELQQHDPEILNHLINNFQKLINIFDEIISIIDFGFEEKPFVFINPPKDIKRNITHLRSKDLEKLRVIVGEIRSRSQSSIKVTNSTYECPNCGGTIHVVQVTNMLREPKMCYSCGRKAKFKLLKKDMVDTLKLSVNDLYENLKSNQVPEEINVFLNEDRYKFSTLKEGDRVRLIGSVGLHPVFVNGKESTEMLKIFTCYGIEKLEDDYDNIFISDEDEKVISRINKAPFDWFQNVLFKDLNDVDLGTKFGILGLFGKLNLLFAGRPGCGKSQIQERISKVGLRGSFVNCITSSQSGIVGSVNKNPFTGKWSVDGGILRPMHPGGLSVLDELNRDGEGHNVQKSVLEVMSSKTLSITKAGNRLKYPCDVSVWASVNPIGSYNVNANLCDNFSIIEPLWDRFDFIVFFNNYLDWSNIDLVTKLLEKNKQKWEVSDRELLFIKKYQIKANLLDVKFSKDDYRKLGVLAEKLVKKIDPKSSYRKLNSMKNLLEAICRLYLRESPVDSDFRLLSDLIINAVDSRSLFEKSMVYSNGYDNVSEEVLV